MILVSREVSKNLAIQQIEDRTQAGTEVRYHRMKVFGLMLFYPVGEGIVSLIDTPDPKNSKTL